MVSPFVYLCWTITGATLVLLYMFYDRFRTWVDKYLRGRKRILCEGVGSAIQGDIWYTNIIKAPVTGRKVAYRYPGTKIGAMTVLDDGTGYYCGEFRWKYA